MPVAEGMLLPFLEPDAIRTDLLEFIPYHGGHQVVEYESPEWSCVCPFSGLPDFGTFKMTYVPNDRIVELKSLKYYLISFRNVGIYQELATARLHDDLMALLRPVGLKIETIYLPRGGIHARCTRLYGDLAATNHPSHDH